MFFFSFLFLLIVCSSRIPCQTYSNFIKKVFYEFIISVSVLNQNLANSFGSMALTNTAGGSGHFIILG